MDEALKYESGPVAELLKSVKRNFGTEGVSHRPDEKSSESGWNTEAGGRTGRRETGRGSGGRRGRGKIRDWLLLPRRHIEAMEKIEAVLAKAGANPNNYRLTEFRGRLVAQRDSIFAPYRVDPTGRTNIQRTREKRAPLDSNEDEIILHHWDQRSEGPIIEMTKEEHARIPIRRVPSEINRREFDIFREYYWQQRGRSFRDP